MTRLLGIAALAATASCSTATNPGPVTSAAAIAPDPTGRAYARLLDAAKADPEHADWVALRRAYAASPAYDPLAMRAAESDGAWVAVNKGDWAVAAAQGDKAVAKNYMDVRSQFAAYAGHKELSQAEQAANYRFAYLGELRAIVSGGGDGSAPERAITVLDVGEEYFILRIRGLRRDQQALVQKDGHRFDRLSTVDAKTGARREIWFAIDLLFDRESAAAMGIYKPVADSALPR